MLLWVLVAPEDFTMLVLMEQEVLTGQTLGYGVHHHFLQGVEGARVVFAARGSGKFDFFGFGLFGFGHGCSLFKPLTAEHTEHAENSDGTLGVFCVFRGDHSLCKTKSPRPSAPRPCSAPPPLRQTQKSHSAEQCPSDQSRDPPPRH